MKKILSIALAAAMGLAMSLNAAAADKTLAERHAGVWPKSTDGFVTKGQCLKCHGSYDALAQKTASLEPNPHKSHMGAVNCEECHRADAARPAMMCNQCHKFEVKAKAK